MSPAIILGILSSLIIIAYIFDEVARRTKFSAVILLIFTGILARIGVELFTSLDVKSISSLVPILGTAGLIMIVLEEAVNIEVSRIKSIVLLKALFTSTVLLYVNIFLLRWIFQHFFGFDFPSALMYSIPLSVMSSAVAIPNLRDVIKLEEAFLDYETTFSVILGIATFYYTVGQFEQDKSPLTTDELSSPLILVSLIVLAVLALCFILIWLLRWIHHPSKYFLILAIVFGLYSIGSIQNYPVLLIIFSFGLLITNANKLIPTKIKSKFDFENFELGVNDFKLFTVGIGFLVRLFFSLVFGFSILYSDFHSLWPFLYGLGLFIVLFIPRYLFFMVFQSLIYFGKKFRMIKPGFEFSMAPMANISPRILTSILLFIQIDALATLEIDSRSIADEKSLLLLIFYSTIFILLAHSKSKPKTQTNGCSEGSQWEAEIGGTPQEYHYGSENEPSSERYSDYTEKNDDDQDDRNGNPKYS